MWDEGSIIMSISFHVKRVNIKTNYFLENCKVLYFNIVSGTNKILKFHLRYHYNNIKISCMGTLSFREARMPLMAFWLNSSGKRI